MCVSIFTAQPHSCPLPIATHQATGPAFVTGQSGCDCPSPESRFCSGNVSLQVGNPHARCSWCALALSGKAQPNERASFGRNKIDKNTLQFW